MTRTPLDDLRAVWGLDHGLTTGERAVLTALIQSRDNTSGDCYPGMARMAGVTGMSPRNVRRIIAGLEQTGVVQRRDRRGRTPHYTLFLHKVPRTPCPPRTESPPRTNKTKTPDTMSGDPGHHVPRTASISASELFPPSEATEPARNWTAEAVEVWVKHMGGTMTHGRVGKALKPLVDAHGADEVLRVLNLYLEEHVKSGRGRFATLNDLAAKFGLYQSGQHRSGSGYRDPGAAEDYKALAASIHGEHP